MKNEPAPVFHAYEIMSSPVVTIDKSLSAADGWNFFKEKKLHHMPVLSDEGDITGIVSDGDILKEIIIDGAVISMSSDKKIEDIMTREVITCSLMTDIRRVAKAMFENHIGTMPVLGEDRHLKGIITRSDILYALINHQPLKLWA
jgi:acetoin utilization protein AcuB